MGTLDICRVAAARQMLIKGESGMGRKSYEFSEASYSDTMDWLEESLSEMKMSQQEILTAELLLEETFLRLEEASAHPEEFFGEVTLRKRLGDVSLYFSAKGEACNPVVGLEEVPEDKEKFYNMAILKAHREDMSYSRRNGKNIVCIRVHAFSGKAALYTMAGMAAGCLIGVLLKQLLAPETCSWLVANIFSPVENMFIHALMMLLAPMIFFSVMSGLVSMSDATEIGRLGGELIAVSLVKLAASIAIAIGFGIWLGALPELGAMVGSVAADSTATLSVRDVIVGIIPENIVSPFSSGNLLQVLFLSCFFGLFLVKSGERAAVVRGGIEFLNRFINDIMKAVMVFMPLAVVASMAKMMLNTDFSMLWDYGRVIGVNYIAQALVLLVLCVFVSAVGRCSFVPFLKKIVVFLVLPFSIRSSSACMPEMMKFCSEKLGIEEKLPMFSLPLGLQINMTGSAAYIVILALSMRLTFGLPMDAEFLLSFFFAVLLLTFAFPSVPGSAVILLASVFEMVGVPGAAIMLFVGIDPILDCMRSAINVAGNISSSFMLARLEDKVDEKIYQGS